MPSKKKTQAKETLQGQPLKQTTISSSNLKASVLPKTKSDEPMLHEAKKGQQLKDDKEKPNVLTPVLSFPTQQEVITLRQNKIINSANDYLTQITNEIVDELHDHPDTPEFHFNVNNIPDEVIAIIINSMVKKNWQVDYDGVNHLRIILPYVPTIAPDYQVTGSSSVNPL